MGLTRLRLVVLAFAYAVLGAAAGGIFDEFRWALVGAPCLPIAVVAVLAGRSVGLRCIGAAIAVVVATGLVIVAVGGSGSDFTDAFTAGVRRLLSTEWPSPRRGDLIGVVAAGLCAAAAGSALLATWRRWHLLPLLPLLIVYVAVIGLSAPLGARPAVLVALSAAAVLFATLRNEGTVRERRLLLRGERRLLPLVGVAALVSVALSIPIAFDVRADPRQDAPARETAVLLDPIEATIALRALDPPIPLHLIAPTNPGDPPPGGMPTRWRTAALQAYDGRRWTPTLTLRPIGDALGPVTGETVDVGMSFLDDDLSLVPLPGDPVRIDAAVETDLDRTVVRLIERPQPGDVVHLVSNITPEVIDATGSPLAIRPVDENVAGLTGLAETLGGDGAVLDQLVTIEETMHDDFVLESGAPGGGLQRVLIDRFLRDTQRGNTEQFATAFVLLARSLGVDARVATGFVVDQPPADGPLTLNSSDAVIWPEVGLADGAWLPFDPVPDDEAADATPPPPQPQVQSPAAPQPPIAPPPESTDDSSNADAPTTDTTGDTLSTVTLWVTRGAVVFAALALPFVIGIGLITGAKYRRRRRRLRAAEPAERIRGAWASATDGLVDAGLEIGASSTDREIALHGEPLAPTARRELHRLATLSGAATYGSPNRPDLLSQDAVACLGMIDAAIGARRTRWQRIRWRLSLRSFRSTTRSPVTT